MPIKPSLPELQRWMRWVLTRPDGVSAALAAPGKLPGGWTRGPEPRRLLSAIGETAAVSRAARLSIYGNGYFLRIIECLGQNYEAARNVLGGERFAALARAYLVRHPSTHRCIDNVGAAMDRFLARRPETRAFPFLPDLARLEWAYHEAFYADDRPAFDFAALRDVPLDRWARARVELDPSVRLLDLEWPVERLWRADGAWSRRRVTALKRRPSPLLVYRRPDGVVRVTGIEAAAFGVLSAFKAGRAFGSALKAAPSPSRVMSWFRQWAAFGVVRGISFHS